MRKFFVQIFLLAAFLFITGVFFAGSAAAVAPPGPGTSLGISGECVDQAGYLGPRPSGEDPCIPYDQPRLKADSCVYSGGVAGYRNSQGTCYPITNFTDYPGYSNSGSTSSISIDTKGTCGDIIGAGDIVSRAGFVQWLCSQSNSNPDRNAIEVLIEVLANYILGLGTFILVLVMALAFVQIVTAGASPEALKAGKKRLLLATSSIAVIAIGRVILDLIGVTGGNFLGVNVQAFNQNTVPEIIRAVYNYLLFVGGSLGVGMIIFGGIKMMTSAGNPQAIQGARKVIMFAVIGLLGLASIGIIITLVQRIVTG